MNKKDLRLHSKPWITPKIYRLIKYRDKLLRKHNKKFSNSNDYLYKKFRNRVVSELRTSKVNYYKKFFSEHKSSSMKMLWSGIKSIINIKNSKFHNISQIVQSGVAISMTQRKLQKYLTTISLTLLLKLIMKFQDQENPL